MIPVMHTVSDTTHIGLTHRKTTQYNSKLPEYPRRKLESTLAQHTVGHIFDLQTRLWDTRAGAKVGGYAWEKARRPSAGTLGCSLVFNTICTPKSDTLDNPCFPGQITQQSSGRKHF